MEVRDTHIPGVKILKPKVFGDERGYFFEAYNKLVFDNNVQPIEFIQSNESKSSYGVLRGMHFQTGQHAQAKLVRAIVGKIWDVVVDIRNDSPTRGQWVGVELSDENKEQLWVPQGFAHGFVVLSDVAIVNYMVAGGGYSKEAEGGLRYNDPAINISWQEKIPLDKIQANERDASWPLYEQDKDYSFKFTD